MKTSQRPASPAGVNKNSGPGKAQGYACELRFYRVLGMPLLKKVIMKTIGPLILLVNRREEMPSYFVGNPFQPASLNRTLKWLFFNEFVHLFLILVTGAIGYAFWQKGYMEGVIFMGLIILLNMGLALLQRMNRARIQRTIHALQDRGKHNQNGKTVKL